MNMHLQGGVAVGARPNAGIDVSKQHLDVCVGTEARRVANNAPGWDELTAMLQAADVDLVVIEATGGYDRGLVCALQGAGLAVARVNPRQAREFAKSMGVLAKTDQVDARTLREFADVLSRHEQRARYITPMLEQARADLAELMTFASRRACTIDLTVKTVANPSSRLAAAGFVSRSERMNSDVRPHWVPCAALRLVRIQPRRRVLNTFGAHHGCLRGP